MTERATTTYRAQLAHMRDHGVVALLMGGEPVTLEALEASAESLDDEVEEPVYGWGPNDYAWGSDLYRGLQDALEALAEELGCPGDEICEAWASAASSAGDGASMLIAEIALGRSPADGMTPEEIEAERPTVTDSGEEIAALEPGAARAMVASWGSPWPEDEEEVARD